MEQMLFICATVERNHSNTGECLGRSNCQADGKWLARGVDKRAEGVENDAFQRERSRALQMVLLCPRGFGLLCF